MTPYFIVLALACLLMKFYVGGRNKVILILIGIILAALVGFRDETVGVDTMAYCRVFGEMAMYHSMEDVISSFSTEPGWNICNWILSLFSHHYYVILCFVGIVCSSCALFLIRKLSVAPVLSVFIYITLGYYLFGFAASRQAVSMAIYMLALPYLLKGDMKKYMIVVIIASLFHKTVLLGVPMWFLFRMPYNKKTLSLVVLGGIVAGIAIPQIMAFAATVESRYGIYTEVEGGGEMFMVFYLMLTAFFMLQRKHIITTRLAEYDIMLLMMIFGTLIYIVVIMSGLYGEVTRFAMYYHFVAMFIWAELAKNRIKKFPGVFWLAVVVAHIGYFTIYLSKIGGIVPYVFNSALN